MAKTHQYCVAENWGKGFIEHNDSRKIAFSGLPGNVWQVPAHNKDANLWISKVLGVVITPRPPFTAGSSSASCVGCFT